MGVVMSRNPVYLPAALYSAAKAAGADMAGYEVQQPIPMTGGLAVRRLDPDVSKMNRKQRRSMMRKTGRTWAQARELAKQRDRDRANEAAVVKAAAKLPPAEARKALAEWAARGGK